MGIKVEDTGNHDPKAFDRANFEIVEFSQWNVGTIAKNGKIVLGFRRKLFGVAYKTFGYMLEPDDAIRIGERLISAGVSAKSKRLTEKNQSQGGTVI